MREKISNLLMWPTFGLSTADAQAGFIMAAIESEPAAGDAVDALVSYHKAPLQARIAGLETDLAALSVRYEVACAERDKLSKDAEIGVVRGYTPGEATVSIRFAKFPSFEIGDQVTVARRAIAAQEPIK